MDTPKPDPKLELIQQYLATRRRIRDIEKKALKKIGASPENGPTCSFCGAGAKDVPLVITNEGNARICSECVVQISRILKDKDDG